MFDESSLLKSTISQQVERTKTKEVSQRVEVDATLPSLLVSIGISLDVTQDGDHVAILDAKQVIEHVDLIAVKGTKENSQKWVKKYEFQVGELG